MNRWDEIQATARDAADWVCADPADRDRMANDLIKLVGLMIQAAGKGVAIAGEVAMNENGDGDPADSARYLVGEDVQRAAGEAIAEASAADIERYERSGLAPAWVSRRVAARDGEDVVVASTVGAGDWVQKPDGKLSLVPFPKPVTGAPCGAVDADDLDACGACFPCRRSRQTKAEQLGNPQPVDLSGFEPTTTPDQSTSPFGPVQRWGMLPKTAQQQPSQDCGSTPDGPACDWDPSCTTHGILGG